MNQASHKPLQSRRRKNCMLFPVVHDLVAIRAVGRPALWAAMPPRVPTIHIPLQARSSHAPIGPQMRRQMAPVIIANGAQGWIDPQQVLHVGCHLRQRFSHMEALRRHDNATAEGRTKDAATLVGADAAGFAGVAVIRLWRPHLCRRNPRCTRLPPRCVCIPPDKNTTTNKRRRKKAAPLPPAVAQAGSMNLQQMLLLRTMLCNAAGDVPAARGPQTEGGAPIETAFGEAAPMRDELLIKSSGMLEAQAGPHQAGCVVTQRSSNACRSTGNSCWQASCSARLRSTARPLSRSRTAEGAPKKPAIQAVSSSDSTTAKWRYTAKKGERRTADPLPPNTALRQSRKSRPLIPPMRNKPSNHSSKFRWSQTLCVNGYSSGRGAATSPGSTRSQPRASRQNHGYIAVVSLIGARLRFAVPAVAATPPHRKGKRPS